jgi:hypothetical protein
LHLTLQKHIWRPAAPGGPTRARIPDAGVVNRKSPMTR